MHVNNMHGTPFNWKILKFIRYPYKDKILQNAENYTTVMFLYSEWPETYLRSFRYSDQTIIECVLDIIRSAWSRPLALMGLEQFGPNSHFSYRVLFKAHLVTQNTSIDGSKRLNVLTVFSSSFDGFCFPWTFLNDNFPYWKLFFLNITATISIVKTSAKRLLFVPH